MITRYENKLKNDKETQLHARFNYALAITAMCTAFTATTTKKGALRCNNKKKNKQVRHTYKKKKKTALHAR